jgi:integrase
VSVYDRNKNKPGLRPNYWIKYKAPGWDEPIREPGKGTIKASAAWEVELKRQIKAGTWTHPNHRGGAAQFDVYARTVLARRIARGVATAQKDERGHIENHLIPIFGKLQVAELTFRVIKQGFEKYMDGSHAGRTVRNIHSTLRAILIEAAEDGLIATAPTPLSSKRDHVPAPKDKDPKWRKTAQFSREEVGHLIGCENVLTMRRVLYATYFLTGSRAMEILPLTVEAYMPMDPWPCLAVVAEKTGRHVDERMRYAPVPPELKTWLDWWLEHEYEVLVGHRPRPSDPLFPNISRRRKGELFMSHNQLYKLWQRHDLPAAGLRHRRLHDARRTQVSVLRSAGVPDNIIRAVTHASTADSILDAYTTWEWAGLCKELERVRWGLPTPPTAAPRQVEGTNVVPLFAGRS